MEPSGSNIPLLFLSALASNFFLEKQSLPDCRPIMMAFSKSRGRFQMKSLAFAQSSSSKRGLVLVVGLCFLVCSPFAHSRDALAITSPLPDERFIANETVTLKVSPGGRHVDASEIVWTSDLSGDLGHGPEIKVSKLLPGRHTITVRVAGETQVVSIRVFKDLLSLYQTLPAAGEIKRIQKDFAINWIDGTVADEKWATYDPPVFNQASLAPSKVVVIANLDVLRHQVFSEPLPFTDGHTPYDHFRKYIKQINLWLDCADNSGASGVINLHRWQNTWNLWRQDCKSPSPTDPKLLGYAGSIFLLMHEARHSEPSDSGHTSCYGFQNMDPSFDRGSGHARAVLYAMWVYKYGLYDPPAMRQEARTFAYATLSRLCSKPTSSNPKIQAIIDELLAGEQDNNTSIAPTLAAPALLSPENGAIFQVASNPSRAFTLKWSSVPSAAAYVVQWDYCWGSGPTQHCSSEPTRSGLRERQPQIKDWWAEYRNFQLGEWPTEGTSYSFSFVGTQPGRWRVWAVNGDNQPGTKSPWYKFEFQYSR
jgi:hypothetical protein